MTINFPLTTINIVRGQSLLTEVEQRALIVGAKLSAGSALDGVLLENVGTSESEINAAFGVRSHVAEMVREFRAINGSTPLDVLPLDDEAGATQATAEVAFAGTATETGTLFVIAGSDARYRIEVPVITGDTATTLAGKVATAAGLLANAPFTVAAASGDATFTAANGGTIANDWTIGIDGQVAGITVTLTGWSGGLTNPTLTNLFDAVGNVRYQTIVWPGAFTLSTVESFLDARFNPDGELLQGVAFATLVDTVNNVISASDALQSQSMVLFISKAVSRGALIGGQHREFPDVISAKAAAFRALRFTDSASLSQFLSTPAAFDQFGGRALATLPYANTVVPGLPVIKPIDDLTRLETDTIREGGVSTIGPNRNFSAMVLSEVVTTSNKNNAGDPDPTFKFLNTVDAADAVRTAFFVNARRRFAQSRLTTGDLVPGRDVVNEDLFRAFLQEIYQTLSEDAIVSAGAEDFADFNANLIITIDKPAGKITFACAPILVTGLRIILGTIEVNLG